MLINIKLRMKNAAFWATFVPALILMIETAALLAGVELDLSQFGSRLLSFINALFAVLALLGVVNDCTTPGFSDSSRALARTELGQD